MKSMVGLSILLESPLDALQRRLERQVSSFLYFPRRNIIMWILTFCSGVRNAYIKKMYVTWHLLSSGCIALSSWPIKYIMNLNGMWDDGNTPCPSCLCGWRILGSISDDLRVYYYPASFVRKLTGCLKMTRSLLIIICCDSQ
jgi:hypothetical protein